MQIKVRIHYFVSGYCFPNTICCKDYLVPLIELVTCIKNHLTKYVRFISGLSILVHEFMSIFMLIPHHLDYCSLIANFEIKNYKTSNSIFFKIVLPFWVPLIFHINFRMGFSTSAKNIIEVLLGTASVDSFEKCQHINNAVF